MELTNNTGGSITYYEVLVANNAFSTPSSFTAGMQAETTRVAGSGTIASDATCSGGQYVGFSFTNSECAAIHACRRFYRALGIRLSPAGLLSGRRRCAFVRPHIYDATGTFVLWSGTKRLPLIGPALADLGVIPLPPGGYSSAWGRCGCIWHGAQRGAVAALDTDIFAFFPCQHVPAAECAVTVSNGATM